ncbi:adenylosuccinate lyase [Rhodobacteraceae bacterium CCMM004]|nr:adenylosuccinate lyase [Rhodobacteraceae bacterium CCMM004]
MKTKIIIAAAALAVAPTFAAAMCSGLKHQDTAMSCADGSVYDADTNTCVKIVTG